jgi:hypothetical protein
MTGASSVMVMQTTRELTAALLVKAKRMNWISVM